MREGPQGSNILADTQEDKNPGVLNRVKDVSSRGNGKRRLRGRKESEFCVQRRPVWVEDTK